MFSIFSKFGTTVGRAIKPTLEKPLTRSLNTLPNVGSSEVGSLIKPTFKNIEGFTDYVDMTKQPTMGIVTRSFFRAKRLASAQQALGETPILHSLNRLKNQGIHGADQLPYIHGSEILGNMYTQHPDRLVPFWLRCKEMNLTELLLSSMTFPDDAPRQLRPIITQNFMDIVENLTDIENGQQAEGKVDAGTEAEFVAYRRTEDIKIKLGFLDTASKIWMAEMVKSEQSSPNADNRSQLIKDLLSNPAQYQSLARDFWGLDAQNHRSYIWHDTDTGVTPDTPNAFLKSVVSQCYYGARLVSEHLPNTGFDIDPNAPDLSAEQKNKIKAYLHDIRQVFSPSKRHENNPYKSLQKALITLNDLIESCRFNVKTIDDFDAVCNHIIMVQKISGLLAELAPQRYGKVAYLINCLKPYVSVTARVRESDIFDWVNQDQRIAAANPQHNINDAMSLSIAECQDYQPVAKDYHWHGIEGREKIIYDCNQLWQQISTIAPVHLTIADFGTIDQERSLLLANSFKPHDDSVVLPLPERPEDSQQLTNLLEQSPEHLTPTLNRIGILLGKSDQIKRTRAPFYSLALNLRLARHIDPKLRYVGNGSTIVRGGTLTHLTWANLGQRFGLGKTVQQGDSFRSMVNEYTELEKRATIESHPASLFETVALHIGSASHEVMTAYQQELATAIAKGALNGYPQEASRGHFKNLDVNATYETIMGLPMAERVERIKTEILPNLRAIPETNIALSQHIYPTEQDQKVARTYSVLLNDHRPALIHFYAQDTPCKVPNLPDHLQDMMTKHHQALSAEERHQVVNELNLSYIPPALQFSLDMVGDTLRQIPPNVKVRSIYEQILTQLRPDRSIPDYINTGAADDLSMRPI